MVPVTSEPETFRFMTIVTGVPSRLKGAVQRPLMSAPNAGTVKSSANNKSKERCRVDFISILRCLIYGFFAPVSADGFAR